MPFSHGSNGKIIRLFLTTKIIFILGAPIAGYVGENKNVPNKVYARIFLVDLVFIVYLCK